MALGGNIGKAVLDLEPFAPDLTYVLELSSFQIDLAPSLAPDAAALLNITPDHLDRHGTLENYARIKAQVFAQLGPDATAVIGVDDEPCRAIAETLHGPFAVKRIAVGHAVENGVWAADGVLVEMEGGQETGRADLAGIGSLRGAHNWQNAAAAYALARSQGLDAGAIQQGLKSFAGLAHRMEQVARRGQRAVRQRLQGDQCGCGRQGAGKLRRHLLDHRRPGQGGRARGLEPFYPKIARAYLIGEAAEAFARQLGDAVDTSNAARSTAPWRKPRPTRAGPMRRSPLCYCRPLAASYDQFDNFAKRGDAFRDLVMSLDGARSVTQQGRAA